MRRIISFFVREHLFADLSTLILLAVGIASVALIRRETFPNVDFDIITIRTLYPGASPEEVEKLVTNPIEQDLQEVDGIKKVQSTSLESMSSIVVFLDPDSTTQAKGKSDIQDVVDRISDLPEGAKEPVVTALESKQTPIIEVTVAGDLPPLELRATAKRIEKELEKVRGVARVVSEGIRDLEIRVEASPQKLSAYGLSLDDLINALKRQNVSIPGGTLEADTSNPASFEKIVRTKGDFAGPEDVANTVIRANDVGRPIRVSDVARVYNDLEKAQILTRANGLPGLILTVLAKEKADAITVVDLVRKRIDELKGQMDPRVKLGFVNDFSEFIRRRLGVLSGNLLIGLSLVVLVLPLMIPLRFALLISMGIPFSFLGAMILFYTMGYTINLISMIGLIIVSGMLVDDAIVVTENVVRRIEEGQDPQEAAIDGTAQMVAPVTASVTTTVLAFAPLMFMSGIFGKFVFQIPLGVILALGVSLIEAFFLLPSHIATWIAPGMAKLKEKPDYSGFMGRARKMLHTSRGFWEKTLVPKYEMALRKVLTHRYWMATGVFGLLILSLVIVATRMTVVLFPPEGIEVFFIRTEAPVGTSLEKHSVLIQQIEKKVVEHLPKEELQDYTTMVGIVQQDPHDPETRRGSEFAQVIVYLTPEQRRTRDAKEIIEDLRQKLGKPPGFTDVSFARVNNGPPVGKPVSLGVRGRTYEEILPAVKELKTKLGEVQGVTDIKDNYVAGKEEIRLSVDPAEAAAAGLSVFSIGNTVRAAFEGIVATSIRELDEAIDVRVSLPKAARMDEESLDKILVPNPMGNLIPLSSVAKKKTAHGLSQYQHEGGSREVKVTADVDTKVISAVQANNIAREFLPELRQKFPTVNVEFGGEDEDTQESLASLGRAFLLAVMGIFMILVLTFRSLTQPLLVLLTIPLGLIAVIWAFFLHGMPFSFLGMMGIVALAGVIVNNAIVLVDFVNQNRLRADANADPIETIIQGAVTRLRPIILTTGTTVAGLMPTAYGIGGEDKFVTPIAMALGWGLLFGSALTAFVFPGAMAILDDWLRFWNTKVLKRKAKRVRTSAEPEAIGTAGMPRLREE